MMDKNIDAFLALLKAGLWEKDALLSIYNKIDYNVVLRYAEQQSVVGLVAAGIEHIKDKKVPQEIVLQFVGQAIQLEQRNQAMNVFISGLVGRMRNSEIYTLLVKGQGVAQCYERPSWRVSGDVDFLLCDSNYKKAKDYLLPLSSGNKHEERYSQHLGMTIEGWYVEIHGSLRTGLSARVDKTIDEVQNNVFYGGNVRTWQNEGSSIPLPAPSNDVFFIFTHFIKHFYKEGMNIRQLCDWCRLLWMYKKEIKVELLDKWLRNSGLMSEWKAFAALAVNYLAMPVEAMPFYEDKQKWHKKAKQIINFVIKDYKHKVLSDTYSIGKIFPRNTILFMPSIMLNVNWLKIKERIYKRDK